MKLIFKLLLLLTPKVLASAFCRDRINNYIFGCVMSFKPLTRFSPIILISHHTPWSYMGLFCIFFTSILFFYFKLYSWRNLSMSFSSFICFFILNCQFFLYLGFFIILIFYMPAHPILLKDISVFSQFRYLFFSLVSIFIALFMLFSLIFNLNFRSYFSSFSFPSPKDEFRFFIDSWQYASFGKFFLRVSLGVLKKVNYQRLFFFIDCLSYLPRILSLLIFINFCFFAGDLKYLFYMSPLTFCVWVLSLFLYYIEWMITANGTFLRERIFLEMTPAPKELNLNPNAVIGHFKFTPLALSEGYTIEKDLGIFVPLWYEYTAFAQFFGYRKKLQYCSVIIFLVYFICWSHISIIFFIKIPSSTFGVGWFASIRGSRAWRSPTGALRYYASASDARFPREYAQNPIRVKSNFEFAVGHPVIGSPNADGLTYTIHGFLTRDPRYGVRLLDQPLLPNKHGVQHVVFFSKPLIVDIKDVTLPIIGSEAKLNTPGVKAIIEHYAKEVAEMEAKASKP